MKPICYILICCLYACATDSEPLNHQLSSENQIIDTLLVKEGVAEKDTVKKDGIREFSIQEMPLVWILLSDEDGSLVIIDSWESQGEQLEFIANKDGGWRLDIMYAQDSETGKISEFKATISEGEIVIVRGSFVYTGDMEVEPRLISFEWNQMARLCEFTNIGLGSEHFTPEGSVDFFEIIVYEREEG